MMAFQKLAKHSLRLHVTKPCLCRNFKTFSYYSRNISDDIDIFIESTKETQSWKGHKRIEQKEGINESPLYQLYKRLQVSNSNDDNLVHRLSKKKKTWSQKGQTNIVQKIHGPDSESFEDVSEKIKLLKKLLKNHTKVYHALHVFVLGTRAAKTLIRHLKKDLKSSDIILESFPGLGVLTKEILDSTESYISVCEPHPKLNLHLEKNLLPLYLSKLQIHEIYLLYYKVGYLENYNKLNLSIRENLKIVGSKPELWEENQNPIIMENKEDMLEENKNHKIMGSKPKLWKESGTLRIVGSIINPWFFQQLCHTYVLHSCFFETQTTPIFYLYVNQSIFHLLMFKFMITDKRSLIIYHTMKFYFNIELLDAAPSSDFYSKYKKEYSPMFLIKITQNNDISTEVGDENLENFHYFILSLMSVEAKEPLFIQLEKWIPDCVIFFIKHGVDVYKRSEEYSSSQLLSMYHLFIKHPDYTFSSFQHQKREYYAKYFIDYD